MPLSIYRGINKKCRKDASSSECSNHGTCLEENCKCDEPYYRKYCECSDQSCRFGQFNKDICSGHGKCECGECICDDGYNDSDACDCPDKDDCTAPSDNTTCSLNGVCKCGVCHCQDKNNKNKYCEQDSTRLDCNKYKACVQCKIYQKGEFVDPNVCSSKCEKIIIKKFANDTSIENRNKCPYLDDEGCISNFYLPHESTGENVYVFAEEIECPPPENFHPVIWGTLAGVVMTGLMALLLWKLITSYQDRREFASFQEEVKKIQCGTVSLSIHINKPNVINLYYYFVLVCRMLIPCGFHQ